MARILVATTEKELRSALEFEGHAVAKAETAAEAVQEACSEQHDMLVMDSVVHGIAAYGLCRTIRTKSKLGIMVLGGKLGSGAIDALNAGADEYVEEPFIIPELAARVRAMLRRVARPGGRQIVLPDRTIDFESRKIKGSDGRVSHLTPKEFLVLQCLATHADKPRTHQSLAQTVWQREVSGEVEYMRIVVKQLRRKLEPDPDNPRYILTERSVGYRFHMPLAATQ